MRAAVVIGAVVGLVACGKAPEPNAAGEVGAVTPAAPVEARAADVHVASAARGMTLGIIYANSMMGELEPCG